MSTAARHAPEREDAAGGPSGWKSTLLAIKQAASDDNLGIVAAGVAFYALLAIFPAIAALVALYALFVDPAELTSQSQALSRVLPEEAARIVTGQFRRIVSASDSGLSLAAIGGALLALWSATKGIKAILTALNIAYDAREARGFVLLNALALLFTLAGILLMLALLAGIAGIPAVLAALRLEPALEWALSILRWPAAAALIILALAALYRFGPSRTARNAQSVGWGALAATLLWIAASMLFSWYVSSFGSYNETYGSLGAVIVLLMWFYLSAYVVLLGAELNAVLERRPGRAEAERAGDI